MIGDTNSFWQKGEGTGPTFPPSCNFTTCNRLKAKWEDGRYCALVWRQTSNLNYLTNDRAMKGYSKQCVRMDLEGWFICVCRARALRTFSLRKTVEVAKKKPHSQSLISYFLLLLKSLCMKEGGDIHASWFNCLFCHTKVGVGDMDHGLNKQVSWEFSPGPSSLRKDETKGTLHKEWDF